MRAPVTIFVAVLALACVVGSRTAIAAPGGSTNTSTDPESGTIIPTATQQGWTGTGGSGPRCTWQKVPDIVETGGEIPLPPERADGEIVRDGPRGEERFYYRSGCTDNRPNGFFWVPTVSVPDLRADAYQRIEKQLPLPGINISPDPAAGAFVNFGLWLAVDDPGSVSATAEAGPVWVTITAAYDGTTWNMGNGDAVECSGLGTPIVDLDTDEQGPCGYTYEQSSAPKYTGGGLAYAASATGTWSITWVDYTGATGTLASLERTTQFDYQVREIQTVGVTP
jgi:hypothetical protein